MSGDFSESVISVYRGWRQLVEEESGWELAKWVLINDLSLSTVEPRSFSALGEVRKALEELLAAAPSGKAAERIQQSLFYIDQSHDEPVTREAVIKRGIPWRPVEASRLDTLQGDYQALARRLIETGELTEDALQGRYGRDPGELGVVTEIELHGRSALELFYKRFPDLFPAQFESIEVISGLPWTNMVTYEQESLKLIVNRGELADNNKGRRGFLGLHEVAGHVLHFSQLLNDKAQRDLAPHLLALAIHTYDAYFIEGIAQFLTSVYVEKIMPGPTLLNLDVKRTELWVAVRHKNISELIEGACDSVAAAAVECGYLGGDQAKLCQVYEAIRKNIFFCCQFLVYFPSHQALLPALRLAEPALGKFLGSLLRRHHSPEELDRLVSDALL